MIPDEAEPLLRELGSLFPTAKDLKARRRFAFLSPTGWTDILTSSPRPEPPRRPHPGIVQPTKINNLDMISVSQN
jgi:hypothetical protein